MSNGLFTISSTWVHVGNYNKVHHDKVSDVTVLRVNSQENIFTRVLMHKWVLDQLEQEQVHNREIQANFAEITYRPFRGLNPRINPDKQPRNYKEAMKAIESQAWAAAYNLEYIRFKERGVFQVKRLKPGIKILDTLNILEYKEDNGEFIKCKARLCARGDQQLTELTSRRLICMLQLLRQRKDNF
jgi:hypothetical protein